MQASRLGPKRALTPPDPGAGPQGPAGPCEGPAHLPWDRHTVARIDLGPSPGEAGREACRPRQGEGTPARSRPVQVLNPELPMPVVCLKGPKAVGKTSPARCLAGALGRVCAQVDCAELVDAGALLRED